jgi:penicillin-binding protein 2
MSVIHAPQKPELDSRYIFLLGGTIAGLIVVFCRLWYLQVVEAPELKIAAEKSLRSKVSTLAPRGLIYDRNGVQVAGVQTQMVVTAIPAVVKKQPWVIDKIANMLNVSSKKIWNKINDQVYRPYLPTPISAGIPISLASKIAESTADLPGIDVASQPMRTYPDPTATAHILGHVWIPYKEDIDRIKKQLEGTDRVPSDYVGKGGLEQEYETLLMGSPGSEEVEVDSRRKPIRVVGRTPGKPGAKLNLTLDLELQKFAVKTLESYRNKREGGGAALVAMDMTGGVLAMASVPIYDASQFMGGISQEEYAQLSDPKAGNPMLNRAVLGAYSPGSTFKIVTALAAVKAGFFNPYQTVLCRGYYDLGSFKPRCMGTHGAIAFHEAMTKSCNAYFMDLGIRAGIDNLRLAAKEVGLGLKTEIDLPVDRSGIFPTENFLRARFKLKEDETPKWYKGDTANVSIGQGYVLTTPMQMAILAQTVANRGVRYKPHFISSYVDEDKTVQYEPESTQIEVGNPFWDQLCSALTSVIERGTARKAQIQGVQWAGKTGSTEHGASANTHSWFVGFAPANNPKIAIACVIEKAGHGGDYAAPAAAAVVNQYLKSLEKKANLTQN